MDISKYIDSDLLNKFEFYNYGHSLEILHESYPEEWKELQECFRKLSLSIDDIKKSGGNESPIPKKFDDILYPYGWREIRISGDLIVKKYPRKVAQRRGKFADEPYEVETITGYIDGHNIDFLKTGLRLIWSGTARIRRLTGICLPCELILTAGLLM